MIGHLVHLEGCTIESWSLIGNGSIVLHRVVVNSWAIVAANAWCSTTPWCHRVHWRSALRRSSKRAGRGARTSSEALRIYVARAEDVPRLVATHRLMLALAVTVPAADVELASDALWSLGVVAIEERAVDDERRAVDLARRRRRRCDRGGIGTA